MGFMALIMELSPQINSVQWHWKPQSQQREDLEVGADPAKLSLVTRKVWAGSGRQNEEMNGFSSYLSSFNNRVDMSHDTVVPPGRS